MHLTHSNGIIMKCILKQFEKAEIVRIIMRLSMYVCVCACMCVHMYACINYNTNTIAQAKALNHNFHRLAFDTNICMYIRILS